MNNQQNAVAEIAKRLCEIYGCSPESIEQLIKLTGEIGGVSFVSIKSYNSDESKQTEVADQLINVGVRYDKTLKRDEEILREIDTNMVNVDKFNYDSIDYLSQGFTLEEYKTLVRAELKTALEEMLAPKENTRENNDIYLNKVLVFNTNTLRLGIMGQTLSKTVKQEGVFKKVKSAPKTVAKQIIKNFADLPSSKIRRFVMDNLGGINLKGDTLEIGGGNPIQVVQPKYTTKNVGVKVVKVAKAKKKGQSAD